EPLQRGRNTLSDIEGRYERGPLRFRKRALDELLVAEVPVVRPPTAVGRRGDGDGDVVLVTEVGSEKHCTRRGRDTASADEDVRRMRFLEAVVAPTLGASRLFERD